MPKRTLVPLAWMMTACLATAGCALVTEPNRLQDFQWIAVENPADVTEGIDAAAFSGDINLLGQLRAPTLCFSLSADFDHSGSALTVHVTARSTNANNCAKTPGGFRYTALIRGLDGGDYTLRVIHSVQGAADTEYTKAIEVR